MSKIEDEELLQAYIKAVLRMPAPAARLVLDPTHDTEKSITCAGCQRVQPAADMPMRRSPTGFMYRDNICVSCQKEAQRNGLCAIVCARCAAQGRRNVVVARTYPAKDKDGFVFERKGVYHVTSCPRCCEGQTKSEIAERILWLRKKQLPVPPGSSLIQPL